MDVRGELPWRLAFLAAVTVVGAMVLALFWRPDLPVVFAVLAAAAILWCAVVCGRPRRNDDFEMVESGLGITVPTGVVSHLFSGALAVLPAYFAVVLGG